MCIRDRFRLWPNGPGLASAGTKLEAGPVTLDGAEPVPGEQPDPTTLVVPLGRTLPAGTSIEASLPWRLVLPGAIDDRISRSGDAVRLGTFFPLLAWEPGAGWALEPPTTILGEASTSPAADHDHLARGAARPGDVGHGALPRRAGHGLTRPPASPLPARHGPRPGRR